MNEWMNEWVNERWEWNPNTMMAINVDLLFFKGFFKDRVYCKIRQISKAVLVMWQKAAVL